MNEGVEAEATTDALGGVTKMWSLQLFQRLLGGGSRGVVGIVLGGVGQRFPGGGISDPAERDNRLASDAPNDVVQRRDQRLDGLLCLEPAQGFGGTRSHVAVLFPVFQDLDQRAGSLTVAELSHRLGSGTPHEMVSVAQRFKQSLRCELSALGHIAQLSGSISTSQRVG